MGSFKASSVASSILELAGHPQGVQVAEILRALRERAVTAYIEDVQSVQAQRELFYTFMYVYYGNPFVRLRLHLADTLEQRT